MPSILEDLYHGNIGFDSGWHEPDSPFAKAARKKHDRLEQLMTTLSDVEKERFEQYLDAQADVEDIARYSTYAKSLKFGIQLMAELYRLPE